VGVGGLTVSGLSRNRGGFVKCVAIQKRLGIPALNVPVVLLPGSGRIKQNNFIFSVLVRVLQNETDTV
jgi:hypothetical protein